MFQQNNWDLILSILRRCPPCDRCWKQSSVFPGLLVRQVRKRVKLEGKELEEFLEKDKVKKEAAKKLEQAKEYVSANETCFAYLMAAG